MLACKFVLALWISCREKTWYLYLASWKENILIRTKFYVNANKLEWWIFLYFAGYNYAGVQYSFECWCGDHLSKQKTISEDRCDSTCSGDKNKMCGGYLTVGVYSTGYGGKDVDIHKLCYKLYGWCPVKRSLFSWLNVIPIEEWACCMPLLGHKA